MAADKSFQVDFKKLAILLLPTMLRKPVLGSLVQLVISPVSSIHTRFLSYRKDNLYRLQHNGQVCYLQAALNDKFDPIDKRIVITDADVVEVGFIYWREEERLEGVPMRLDGAYIVSSRGYSGVDGFDFIVKVPAEIMNNEQQIRALVNVFKLAGKQFDITIL